MADVRKLAKTLGSIGTTVDGPDSTVTVINYTIDHIVPGGASDGTTAVYINVGGPIVQVPYDDSLTPAPGQMVRVQITNNSPFIIGRVIGLP